MALDSQNIPIVFRKGLNRADLYLVSPNEQTSLVDCVFDDAETIARRPGFSSLGITGFTGTPYRMAKNGSNPLLESAYGLFLVNPTSGGAAEVKTPGDSTGTHAPYGQFLRSSVSTSAIGSLGDPTDTGAATPFIAYDCAGTTNTAGKVIAGYAWTELNAAGYHRIRFRVIDDASQAVLVDKTYEPAVGEDFFNPRVVAGKQTIWIFWNEATLAATIRADAVNLDTLVFVGMQTVGTPATGVGRFDAVFDSADSMAVLAFRDNGTTFMQFTWLSTLLIQAQSQQKAITINTTNISLCHVGGGKVIASYGIGTGLVKAVSCTFAGVTQVEATVSSPPDGLVAGGIGRVTSYFDIGTSQYVVFYDYSASTVFSNPISTSFSKIVVCRCSTGTMGATDQSNFVSQALIQGIPFAGVGAIGSNVSIMLPVFYPSLTEPSVYVLNAIFPASGTPTKENPRVVARIAWGEAGGLTELWGKYNRVANNYLSSAGKTVIPFSRWGGQTAAAGTALATTVAVCRAEVDFTTQALGHVEQNGVTILAGACPQAFDSGSVVEAGFHQTPLIQVAAVAGPGGNLAAGTYYFAVTYAFKDAKGNWHESNPSAIVSITSGAAGKYLLSVNAPPLCAHSNVQVIVYRSTATSAAVLYRDNGVNGATNIGLTDAAIVSGSQLPTTGGVLANEPLPPCRVIVEHQNRLFFLGGDDGSVVYFTHERSDGYAPEFNVLMKRRVPASWGRVVSGASMDDKLVLLCENRIGFIHGSGPSRTGANDNYSQPIECVSGYGALWTAPLSVLRVDEGVWFQAPLGLRLLSRNLSIAEDQASNDFGAQIDNALAKATVVRALAGMTKQQVRFYTAVGTVFVFDSLWNQWSTFSNHVCVDAGFANGIYYHVTNTPALFKSDPSNPDTDDNGTPITGSVETAWLAVAGLQGFQRVSRALLLGQIVPQAAGVPSSQDMTIQAAFDYENAYTAQSATSPFTVAPFDTTNGQPNRVQVEAQLTRQKCESVRFKITFKNTTASNPTRFRLTALTLRVGLKKGRFKTSQSARV